MKIAFFISSAINIKNNEGTGFGQAKNRTAFSNEERFRQTQFTIANIRSLFPEADMFLFDVGENVADIKQKLNSIKNLTVISGEELDPSVTEICRTNPSKGYCESIGTSLFLKHYIEELKNYDFVIKITGRYFYIDIDKTFLTNENKDKYLCKNTRKFDWQDWWGYPELLKDNNQINWTPTQSYIIGNTQLNNFQESMLTVQSYYCDNPDVGKILDFECMFYHHILRNKTFVEIPWICGGWAGQTGDYSEY